MIDLLRWPLGSLKGFFLNKPSAPVQSEFTLNRYQSDSLGLVDSGYVDRRLDSGSLRGPTDLQLPEYFYQNRTVQSSLPADYYRENSGPFRSERKPKGVSLNPPPANRFKQVYIWQPYERKTTMPFSQMPTVY